MARILIAGCGYVGGALGSLLAIDAHDVWGLRRRPATLPIGIRPVAADLSDRDSLADLPAGLDFVFYLASASGPEDAFYRSAYVLGPRNLIDALDKQGQRPRGVFFVSSTSVYAQRGGEWVDESSPTEPEHFTGRRVLEGERVVREGPFPGTIVRFGGIYGPRRTGLLDRVRSGRAVYDAETPHYTNRIHRDDCAGVLRHLMSLDAPASHYVAVDCEPADEASVMRWLAGVLGAPLPRPARADERTGRPTRSNKRCCNQRLLSSGYAFAHPTFREGYRAVIEGMP